MAVQKDQRDTKIHNGNLITLRSSGEFSLRTTGTSEPLMIRCNISDNSGSLFEHHDGHAGVSVVVN